MDHWSIYRSILGGELFWSHSIKISDMRRRARCASDTGCQPKQETDGNCRALPISRLCRENLGSNSTDFRICIQEYFTRRDSIMYLSSQKLRIQRKRGSGEVDLVSSHMLMRVRGAKPGNTSLHLLIALF